MNEGSDRGFEAEAEERVRELTAAIAAATGEAPASEDSSGGNLLAEFGRVVCSVQCMEENGPAAEESKELIENVEPNNQMAAAVSGSEAGESVEGGPEVQILSPRPKRSEGRREPALFFSWKTTSAGEGINGSWTNQKKPGMIAGS